MKTKKFKVTYVVEISMREVLVDKHGNGHRGEEMFGAYNGATNYELAQKQYNVALDALHNFNVTIHEKSKTRNNK